jgi:hypothetical protein
LTPIAHNLIPSLRHPLFKASLDFKILKRSKQEITISVLSCLFKKVKSLSLSCLIFSKKWNHYLCLVSSFSCVTYIYLFSYLLNLRSSCRQMISHLTCALSRLFLMFFHQHKARENEREPLLPSPITDYWPQPTSTTTTDERQNMSSMPSVVSGGNWHLPFNHKKHTVLLPTPSRTNRQSFKVRTLLVFKLSSHEYTVLTPNPHLPFLDYATANSIPTKIPSRLLLGIRKTPTRVSR